MRDIGLSTHGSHPVATHAGIARHGSVSVVESLKKPRRASAPEMIDELLTDGHEFGGREIGWVAGEGRL